MTELTPEQVEGWNALAETAHPGPWDNEVWGIRPEDGPTSFRVFSIVPGVGTVAHTYGYSEASAQASDFIAAAREAVPALCRDWLALTAEVERLQRIVTDFELPDSAYLKGL